jgi:hypothetical protein
MTDDHLIHHARQLDEQLSIAFAEIEALTAQLADYTHRGDDVHPVEAAMRDHDEGMTGWQPIETAPKDGTVVFVWYVTHFTSRAAFHNSIKMAFWVAGCSEWSVDGLGGNVPPALTHWMPLPAAPAEGE